MQPTEPMLMKHLIRLRLLRRRRELLARYRDEIERADEELESRETEDIERATEQWDARVLSLLGSADARAISEVIDALRRLDAGDYGVCTSCGDPVAEARLEALPEAATCIACASVLERRTA